MIDSKVALVTGGSRGIGRATCVELAKVGYAVMVNYHENVGAAEETRKMIEQVGVEVDVCQGDVAARSHRDLLVGFTLERFGRIDLLVNSAGIAPPVRHDILETPEDLFDQVLNVNLRATYFMTQRVANTMIELNKAGLIEGGTIVNLG